MKNNSHFFHAVVGDKKENSGEKIMLIRLNHSIFAVLILMVSITIFSSCAKPPTEELAQAEKAIEEAKQKERLTSLPPEKAKEK